MSMSEKLDKLTFLDVALKYRGVALGEDGWDGGEWRRGDSELGLLPYKTFDEMEKNRRTLIKELAALYGYATVMPRLGQITRT